jgi:hypothetical protein
MHEIIIEMMYIAVCALLTYLLYTLIGSANAGYIIVFLMLIKG